MLDDNFLSESYIDGIERIVGLEHSTACAKFKVSSEVIEKRKQFWNNLLYKYSQKLSDETEIDINTLSRINVKLPSHGIQHWVDTGNVSYETHMDEDNDLENRLSLTENESLDLLHHRTIEEKSDNYDLRLSCDEHSASSSVDTAGYILSNMNTTNKVETTAIVEGAKPSTSTNSQNVICKNIDLIKCAPNEMSRKNSGNVVLNNNDNYQKCSLESSSEKIKYGVQHKESNLEKNVTVMQTKSNINTNQVMPLETVNTNDASFHNFEPYCNKLFTEKSPYTINDHKKRNSYIEQMLSNTKLVPNERNFLVEEYSASQDSSTKLGRCKKLYSNRDSPVDLANITGSSKSTLSKSEQFLHPALDLGYKFKKRYLRKKQIYRKRMKDFCAFNNDLMNCSQFSISKGKRIRRNQSYGTKTFSTLNISKKCDSSLHTSYNTVNNLINQTSIKCNSNQYINNSLSTNKYKNMKSSKRSKLNNSVHLKMFNIKQNETSHDKMKNLNPVVSLKRLSEFDIQKYKKSNKVVTRLGNLNPVIYLKRLSVINIQKHKKPSKVVKNIENLNPVVCVKRLSEFDIQKHKKSNKVGTNLENLNLVICLKRLSDSTNKDSLLLPTHQLQNDIITDLSQCSRISINDETKSINSTEDTDSSQTSILLYKCKSSISHDDLSTSNLSAWTKNHELATVTKEEISKRDGELNSNDLYEKLEMTENNVINSSTNSVQNPKDKDTSKTETTKNLNKEKICEDIPLKRSTRKKFNCYEINSEHENKYDLESNESRKTHNVNDSIEANLKIDRNLFLKEDCRQNINDTLNIPVSVRRHINNVTSQSDESEITCKNNCNNNVHMNNDKEMKTHSFVLSDGDDEFVKLVSGLKHEKRPLQKLQNVSFSNETQHSEISLFLSEEENINNAVTTQRRRSQRKVLHNVNTKRDKSKLNVKHLCFRTKIFDSDIESSCS